MKNSSSIRKATERTAGWRVALQGPWFLVLAEFLRNPPLLPAALSFVPHGRVLARVRLPQTSRHRAHCTEVTTVTFLLYMGFRANLDLQRRLLLLVAR